MSRKWRHTKFENINLAVLYKKWKRVDVFNSTAIISQYTGTLYEYKILLNRISFQEKVNTLWMLMC